VSEPVIATKAAARSPGRPRSAEAHRAILESTLTVLGESGIAGLSIEAVAARAGVGKATIYRRWGSKEELILAALANMSPAGPVPDTGSLEGDLTALAEAQLARLSDSVLPRVAPRALAEAMGDSNLHALVLERMVGPMRAMLSSLVGRAVERGELAPGTDVDHAVDVIHGVIVYRIMLARGDMRSAVEGLPGRLAATLRGENGP